jgi:hypothetical protein
MIRKSHAGKYAVSDAFIHAASMGFDEAQRRKTTAKLPSTYK